MSEFKREKRYQVMKLSNPNWKGSCVVVEDDWPEYEIVWKMIQDRIEGKPNIIEQLFAASQRIAELEAIIKASQEQKAQWRREVLEEAADSIYALSLPGSNSTREELRRMAEQPESK